MATDCMYMYCFNVCRQF